MRSPRVPAGSPSAAPPADCVFWFRPAGRRGHLLPAAALLPGNRYVRVLAPAPRHAIWSRSISHGHSGRFHRATPARCHPGSIPRHLRGPRSCRRSTRQDRRRPNDVRRLVAPGLAYFGGPVRGRYAVPRLQSQRGLVCVPRASKIGRQRHLHSGARDDRPGAETIRRRLPNARASESVRSSRPPRGRRDPTAPACPLDVADLVRLPPGYGSMARACHGRNARDRNGSSHLGDCRHRRCLRSRSAIATVADARSGTADRGPSRPALQAREVKPRHRSETGQPAISAVARLVPALSPGPTVAFSMARRAPHPLCGRSALTSTYAVFVEGRG